MLYRRIKGSNFKKIEKAVVLDCAALFITLQTAALHSKRRQKFPVEKDIQGGSRGGQEDVVRDLQLSVDFRKHLSESVSQGSQLDLVFLSPETKKTGPPGAARLAQRGSSKHGLAPNRQTKVATWMISLVCSKTGRGRYSHQLSLSSHQALAEDTTAGAPTQKW